MLKRTKNLSVGITSGRTLDHAAAVYDVLNPLVTFGQEARYSREAIELLSLKGKEQVLDIGCATGGVTIEIAKRLSQDDGLRVIGLDAAPRMIEVASEKARSLKNIRFDVGAAEKLPYANDSFDCIITTFFFHHVDLKLKKESLEEMCRVLKKDGRVVIMDVDIPTNLFGRLCAYAGYWVFNQVEILENINGKLRESINLSSFRSWQIAFHHQGYISTFSLSK